MSTFGGLFAYKEVETVGEDAMSLAFTSCQLLQPLKQDGEVVVDTNQEIEEVLVDLTRSRVKLHVGNKIVIFAFKLQSGGIEAVKSDKEEDSDFEYETDSE